MATALKCLNCSQTLQAQEEFIVCPHCASRWPVVRGIPRFFQQESHYWGEIDRQSAAEFLESTRQGCWREVVRARFSDADMMNGVFNLQRASWLALLGLAPDAVALDVGCGYGAITHSLALSMKEVCAVEAIPERIEFTQERLRQERLENVTLVQASAMNLPFFESSFDLVVLNGILEWVGEWDLAGSPRDVQLKFLASIRRLLKDDGVAVIGIENRLSLGTLRGGIDHSGISYTNLVPRRLATRMLQRSSATHYRTKLNPKKEYRTYTYSARGYRKLFAEARYGSSSVYWASPSYNQPSNLVPLEARRLIHEVSLGALDHPGRPVTSSWRHKAKRMFVSSPVFRWVLPDFVIVASKNAARQNALESQLHEQLDCSAQAPRRRPMVFASFTRPFIHKSILRSCGSKGRLDPFVIKVNLHSPPTADQSVLAEFKNLSWIHERTKERTDVSFRVPKPIGSFTNGKTVWAVESTARGAKFSALIRRPGYTANLERLKNDFRSVLVGITEMSQILQEHKDLLPVNPDWYAPPREIRENAQLARILEEKRYLRSDAAPKLWVQHGDLSVENVFWDRGEGKAEVIDWGEMAAGLPPLYDVLMFVFSSALLNPSSKKSMGRTPLAFWETSFSDTFFSNQGIGPVFRDLLQGACRRLEVNPDLMPSLLLEFLTVRTHYHRSRGETEMEQIFTHLLRFSLSSALPS
ncbi:MAG: methyltransferase domain-containing protein [Terriglobia bacterium]